jgi:cytochrome c peroxidase
MKVLRLGVTALAVWPALAGAQDAAPDLPARPFNYARPDLPPFYTQADIVRIDNTPGDNPVTDEGATLGRVLFYDTLLSRNGAVSCGSCHQQAGGFADPARQSSGFAAGLTRRHSMGLTNARFYRSGRFFWDERAPTLEAQVLMPIQDPVEMGVSLDELALRVAAQPYYPPLFRAAFGDPVVTVERISRSLAQFVRSLVSYRSRYDEGRAQVANVAERFPNFTDEENLGKQLFLGNRTECADCHATDAFAADRARNTGLDQGVTDDGAGNGRFKSPSLRNVALRAPYMHDGRFASLAEVVEFYNSGVQDNPGLDGRLRVGGQPRRLNLNPAEKAALVAFLLTLTDQAMVEDPKFADPFAR